MPTTSDRISLLSLADEHFVSLTTFRKSGERVSTPVWIARDGDALLVTTPDDTGKVKRIRNNPRVELQPSGRMGQTNPEDTVVLGVAEILPDSEYRSGLFSRKHPLEYRIFMFIESRGKAGKKPRVMLRITAPE
jgi:PPOX class probable F420-dependent enzyme